MAEKISGIELNEWQRALKNSPDLLKRLLGGRSPGGGVYVEITTAQAIEELAPLKRFGRALDKLGTVLEACQGAEARERVANEAVTKLNKEIGLLTGTRDALKEDVDFLKVDLADGKEKIDQELLQHETLEANDLNDRLGDIKAKIMKADQEFLSQEADNFSKLKYQGEEIAARETHYADLGKLIKKIQEPVGAIEVE